MDSKERLEDCHRAVNSTLRKLGELYGSIEEFQEEFSDVNKDIELYYNKIEAESGKFKSNWVDLAKELEVDVNISVESLLLYMNSRSTILYLSAKRNEIREEILSFKDILSEARL